MRDGPSELCDVVEFLEPHSGTYGPVREPEKYQTGKVYVLPKALDEQVARLHLAKVGAELTSLTAVQAEYIGVEISGPFKLDSYRYSIVGGERSAPLSALL